MTAPITARKIFGLLAASAIIGAVVVLVEWRSAPKKEPLTAIEAAQEACAMSVTKNYLSASLALYQQQTTPLPSIEQIIVRRRLEEQYCLQYARCNAIGLDSQAFTWAFPASFDGCLKDETLEKYNASSRDGD